MNLDGYIFPALLNPTHLERYHGWKCVERRRGMTWIKKRQWIFERHLLIFEKMDSDAIQAEVNRIPKTASSVQICVTDASASITSHWIWREKPFVQALGNDRIFNTWTLVHDLTQSEETLWEQFHKGAKYVCKSAEKEKIRVEIHENPNMDHLRSFHKMYRPFARQRGLRVPSLESLSKLLSSQSLWVVEAKDNENQVSSSLLIFQQQENAYYLFGTGQKGQKKEWGQYLHWLIMKRLKERGRRWYDLGGVPSVQKENGIFRFKNSMGGIRIGPVREWMSERPLFRFVRFMKRKGWKRA